MSLPVSYGMMAEIARYARHDPAIIGLGSLGYFHDPFNSESFNYDGHEAQGAFYAMATVNIGPDLTVIPGLRYQDLRRTYTGVRGQHTMTGARERPQVRSSHQNPNQSQAEGDGRQVYEEPFE